MWRRKGRGRAGDGGPGAPGGDGGARGWRGLGGEVRRGWRRLQALSWRGVPTEETPAWPHGTPGHHCRFEDADLPAFLARLPAWFEAGAGAASTGAVSMGAARDGDAAGFDHAAARAFALDALALPVGGALARRYAVRREGRALTLDLRARRFVPGEVDLHVPGPAELCERLEEEVDRFFDDVGY